ncbi:MAG: hypothetical protein ABTQ34_00230 [Bdellovibrionales bacterium]
MGSGGEANRTKAIPRTKTAQKPSANQLLTAVFAERLPLPLDRNNLPRTGNRRKMRPKRGKEAMAKEPSSRNFLIDWMRRSAAYYRLGLVKAREFVFAKNTPTRHAPILRIHFSGSKEPVQNLAAAKDFQSFREP